jgi:tricorn protease
MNVHEGDYILKIDGKPVTKDVDPNALLFGTVGLSESVTVNSSGSLEGAHTVSVVPIADEMQLRLEDWIASRKAYVQKASGGQIAYVYVSDMEEAGANDFAKYYYPNVMKPGIIIDVRGNGGGGISGNLLNDLSSKISGFFAHRSGGEFWREAWAPMGQVVAVTNEFAFSDAEYFSEMFKRLKIGPLVGHRTGGGEVGSGNGYKMVDGGSVYIPNYGAWVPGEWVIEGRGAVPDYEVDQDPASVMAGRDPQLDKAIQLIMDNLKKHPFVIPTHPPFPVKLHGSQGG